MAGATPMDVGLFVLTWSLLSIPIGIVVAKIIAEMGR
jgi:hypothetical protein